MAEQFTFDRIQMQRLVRQLVRDELGPRESYFTRPIPQEPVVDHLAGTAYSTITARSSGTPGTGQVQAKKFRSGTAADYADTTGNLVDVLNFGPEILSGSYVICHRHRETGKWLVEVPQGGTNGVIHWAGHNVSTDTTVSGSDGVVNLDTAISSLGSFSLASNAVTAPVLGLATFHWSGVFVLSSSGYLTVWLEEDTGSGYTPLDPTLRDFAGSTTPDSYSMSWPHSVTAAGNKYRISCKCSVSSGTIYATISKGYGGSALAIVQG